MSLLHINPNEDQWGMKYAHADSGATLTGISVGTDDLIMEKLIVNYGKTVSYVHTIGLAGGLDVFLLTGTMKLYFYVSAAAGVNEARYQIYCTNPLFASYRLIDGMFKGIVHGLVIFRELTFTVIVNGHILWSAAKAAHNFDFDRIRIPNSSTLSGLASPGNTAFARMYSGDFSSISDADLLAIHRKYLRTPFITPPELLSYERFRFTGRQPGGDQILAADTNIYNEAPGAPGYGETLAIQGGLTWGDVREKIWTPR